ncbi:MAG: DNA-directed RNA polymerase subunit A'' [Candidatus Aenigmatarchaeota archaeon]
MRAKIEKLEDELPLSVLEDLEEYFKEHDVTKKQENEIIERTKEQYKKATYEPGEAIGILAAQSIAEPSTQMTMRTYHVAGGAQVQVTLGLPKLIEVVDARRNPSTPAMTVYLDEDHNNRDDARKIATKIRETKFKNVISEDTVDLAGIEVEFTINKERLENLDMDLESLLSKVNKANRKVNFELNDNVLKMEPKDEDVSIRDLHKLKIRAIEKRISGIKGITQAVVREKGDEWMISTLGSNLRKVLKIEGVDATRTISNDIREMKKVLGIEACRNSVLKEASDTLEDQGIDVDKRHIMLVADAMTVDGDLNAIGRYGISGEKGSVLARANFEVTVRHLTEAAIEGEIDELNSTVENVLINQEVPIGTGMCDLKFKPPQKE